MKPILLILPLMLSLTACISSTPVRYYALQDGSDIVGAMSAMPSEEQRIGVGPIVLTKVLNRPQLVHRRSQSELVFEESHQWAGRLQEEVSQLLVQQLQALHPQHWIYPYPADARPIPAWQWSADIQQLDGQLGGVVRLQANCRLLHKTKREPLFQRQVTLSQATQGGSMADYVDAQRLLLRALAKQCTMPPPM